MKTLQTREGAESSGSRQTTRVSYILILATLVTYLVVALICVYAGDWKTIWAICGGSAMLVLPYVLFRQRRLRFGVLVLMIIVIATMTAIASLGQGIRDLSTVALPIIFIYVGLTSDRAMLAACGGLTFLALLWLALGEPLGWYAPQPLFSDPWNLFHVTVLALLMVIAAVAVDQLSSNMRRGLEKSRDEIEERKRTEAALRVSEARFRAVVENSHDGILFCDEDAIIQYRSPSYSRINGYTKEERQGHSRFENVHPDDLDRVHRTWQEILARPESSHTSQFRLRHKSGGWRWVEASGQSLLDNPDVRAVVFASRDITDRRQAEDALRASEERFRRMFESSPIGIVFLGKNREITLTNQSYRDFLGMTEAEIIRRGPRGLLHPDDWATAVALGDKLRSGEIPLLHLEQRYIREDGAVVWADAHLIALRDPEGEITQTIGWLQDISDRKRAEEEKARLEADLQQAQKMESVGRLAGGVAHDFNNMLLVISGHAEMGLQQVRPGEPLHASLTEIRTAADRSAELTRRLLAFARKQTISPRALNLGDTIRGMLGMLKRLIGEDIELALKVSAGLWLVNIDPSQVDQILVNLCVNARDAMARGGTITVETRNCVLDGSFCADHPGSTPGEHVLLEVADDGVGMDSETQLHLFEPFFTTKPLGAGTGLGLATIYGAVKQNNGFITCRSEVGVGTVFSIYLPRHPGAAWETRPDEVKARTYGRGTILVVEDEPSGLRLVASMLESRGYTVLAANTTEDAIALAGEMGTVIDLLLTDVVMPGMNGRDLARTLRSSHPGLKTLFMSGYTSDVISNRGILDRGVFFLQKPFSAEELASKVREALAGAG